MPSVMKEANHIGTEARRLGDAAADGFLDMFKNAEKAAEAAIERAGKRTEARAKIAEQAERIAQLRSQAAGASQAVEKSGRVVGFFKACARGGVWLMEQPIAVFVMKPAKWILKGGTSFYTAFPRLAPIATVGAVVVGAGSWLTKRQSRGMQQEFQSEAMAAEPSVSYKNSVSADEAALLEGRMSAGKDHAAAVTAARQQVPTPETAAGL